MATRAPTFGQVAVAIAFAFSCFALLLFLWSTFGGPVPLKPEGYRVNVPVEESAQLAVESDVRIANVSVGKVKSIELADEGPNRDRAVAEIEIDSAYAPIPANTRATLREKTLLGETYVELTPGDSEGPEVPEDGSLPAAQVAPSVQLDEIFRTFDERTRLAFQTWMQQAAIATAGRGADLSAAIANLEPFAADANRVLRVLDSQENAVKALVNNTGVVFEALSERRGQFRGLIENAGAVFATTARRNQDLREAFRALPTFLDESRQTLTRLDLFAANTNPLITQLHPSARELSKVLRQLAKATPDYRGFFAGLRKAERASLTGLPALRRLLDDDLPPLLSQIQPFTQQLGPLVETVGRYRRDVAGAIANLAAASNAIASAPETGGAVTNYLRTAAPLYPESLATFPSHRLTINRANAYPAPNTALEGAGGLPSFETRHCTSPPGVIAELDPNTPSDPDFSARATLDTPENLFNTMKLFAFTDVLSTAAVPAPPCGKQAAQPSIGQVSETSDYPHVYRFAP
ncbi:MAG TPA: MlaD family protein [Solirubrobacterales bacterium]|nr:MlaD family protein [Solirubrobacterales bacterium]